MTRLVGRTTELGELQKELHRASQGEFRCVLLSADPGIGKTRLGAELLDRNRRRTIGLLARAYPLGRTASFGLWAEALDRHLRDLPAETVTSLCGGFLEDLAGLLRSVAAAHGSSPVCETPRFRIFEGLAVVIRNLAAKAPVVVVLDDLHHADGSSWEALNYLAHNLPDAKVLVVGAVRPVELADQPLATEVVLGLEQEGMLRRLPLDPLGSDGVAELAEAMLDRQPPGPLVAWLIERSRGNPLFVLGLVRALVDEGADLMAPDLCHLPEDLAERVGSRLRLLDEPAIATLEMLAVLGHPVELTALALLSDRPLERLGEILEGLVRTRLVVEEEQGRHLTYEIVHPLVQDAVYQGIGGARRRALHRLAARALLASGRMAEAAPHFARSADQGDEEAIEALREAVRQAMGREAYEEAVTILGTLVELLLPQDPRWVEVLDAICHADWVVDDRVEVYAPQGLKIMRTLDALLEDSPNQELRARVKSNLALFLCWAQGAPATAEADELLDEAIGLFEEAGDRRGALFTAHGLAWTRAIRRDWAGMVDHARQVGQAAKAAGENLLAMKASYSIGVGSHGVAAFAEAEAALREAIAIGLEEGNADLSVILGTLAVSLGAEGRIAEALQVLEEAKSRSPDWRRRILLPSFESVLRWLAGDFPAAGAGAGETLDHLAGRAEVRAMRAFGVSFAALAAAECDRLPEARRYAAVARAAYRDGDWMGTAVFSLWAQEVLAWREGRRSQALEGLRTLVSGLRESRSPWVAFFSIDLAELAAESANADAAAEARLRLEEIAGRVDRSLYRALSALAVAWAELAFGSKTDAARWARQAAAWFSELGYRAFEGRALDALGRALATTSPQSAIDAFDRAIETFEACGATWRAQRSLEGMGRLGSPGRRAVAAFLGPASLSKREREVARLASQGLTARQIGQRLFISDRTVETHLTSVYAKLGVGSKMDLVHRAAELVL